MARLGIISFQANGKEDIFLKEELFADGEKSTSELACEIQEPGFDNEKMWATGYVPSIHKVDVEGDAILLKGWVQTENFTNPFKIKVYVEYEEVEKLEEEPEL